MSDAIAVSHGPFGRAVLYHLDRALSTHVHRESHLAFYIRGGPSAHKQVGDHVAQLESQRAIAINPWEPHSFTPCPSGRKTAVLLFYINQPWFVDRARESSLQTHTFDGRLHFDAPVIELDGTLRSYVQEFAALLYNGLNDSENIPDLFYKLTQGCLNPENHESFHTPTTSFIDTRFHLQPIQRPIGTSSRTDDRILKAITLIKNHVSGGAHLDDIASNAGMSRPHFYRLFKEQIGITPNLYMNSLRAEHAIDLLTNTDVSVTEIGESLGYQSQPSFSRFFYMNVGIAPTEYRQSMKRFDISDSTTTRRAVVQ